MLGPDPKVVPYMLFWLITMGQFGFEPSVVDVKVWRIVKAPEGLYSHRIPAPVDPPLAVVPYMLPLLSSTTPASGFSPLAVPAAKLCRTLNVCAETREKEANKRRTARASIREIEKLGKRDGRVEPRFWFVGEALVRPADCINFDRILVHEPLQSGSRRFVRCCGAIEGVYH